MARVSSMAEDRALCDSAGDATLARQRRSRGGVNAPFPIPSDGRYALVEARVLASHLANGAAPLDRDGFATVDILVDEGRIGDIAPARRTGLWRNASARSIGPHGPAAVRRRPYSSRQGPYLASRPEPDRRLRRRAEGGRRRSRRQLERPRRRRAHGVQPPFALTRTAPRPSAPISTASGRRPASAGLWWPRRASVGAAGSNCRLCRCSASNSRSTNSTWRRSRRRSTPMDRIYWAPSPT